MESELDASEPASSLVPQFFGGGGWSWVRGERGGEGVERNEEFVTSFFQSETSRKRFLLSPVFSVLGF